MICEGFAYPKVMKYFEEISAIPRGSYHEEKIVEYLARFAKERGLACYRDETRNVLIDLPATAGYEDEPPLLLQGHTDMVCEKNEGVEHDFLKDPLELYVENGWLRARGTTLGADNGVAVAIMLALLDGESDAHPRLQCLFTASEEVGMDGVLGLDYDRITARRMINMDGENESTIIVGCAGGIKSDFQLPVATEPCLSNCLRLQLKGLAGGHSGEDINKGRLNANKLMGRILLRLMKVDPTLRLISLRGGSKTNAIPREAEANFAAKNVEEIRESLSLISQEIKDELCAEDQGFFCTLEETVKTDLVLDRESTEKTIFLVSAVSNGVLAMHREMKELVAYSRNLGIVSVNTDHADFAFSSRSAIDSQLDQSVDELDAYARMLNGSCEHSGRYPGWDFAERSDIRRRYVEAYQALFGEVPQTELIHAGLECGIIKKKIPDMDMISCGPIIQNLHSPDEALELTSFARFIRLILEILKKK